MFTGIIRNLRKEDKEAVENIFALHWSDREFLERLSFRLQSAINGTTGCIEQGLRYIVAENNGEVVGVLGFRKTPKHMAEFTVTGNSAELYILAVKNKRGGIGKLLVQKAVEETKELGYTEMVLYSGETHKESWGFYDHLGFERVSPATAPNGEPGQIWRMLLPKE